MPENKNNHNRLKLSDLRKHINDAFETHGDIDVSISIDTLPFKKQNQLQNQNLVSVYPSFISVINAADENEPLIEFQISDWSN